MKLQPDLDSLPSYQHLLAGGISGAMGPLANNPIDTLKTRIQRTRIVPGSELEKMSGFQRGWRLFNDVLKNEGWRAFYKGLLPRVMVSFQNYSFNLGRLNSLPPFSSVWHPAKPLLSWSTRGVSPLCWICRT